MQTPFSGTYTYTYTWSPAGSKPPATVYFLETAQAVGTGNGVSADDGLGDANTNPYGGAIYNFSKGTHYVGMAGTSTIKIEIKPSIKASGSGTGAGASYSLSVSLIYKGGYISTSLGGTNHKGAPVLDSNNNPVLDVNGLPEYSKDHDTYDASGVFQANTVIPLDGSGASITYYANSAFNADTPVPNSLTWGYNSTALLHIASTDMTSTQPFTGACAPINNLSVGTEYDDDVLTYLSDGMPYFLTSPMFTVSGPYQEHIKMTLTDSSDGSICGENYYLTFHQPLENTVPLGSAFDNTSKYDLIGTATVGAGGNCTFDLPSQQFNWKLAATVVQGAIVGGTAVYIAVSGPLAPMTTAALAVAGFSLSLVPPQTNLTVKCDASKDEFENSRTDETNIRSGNTLAVWVPTIHRMPKDASGDDFTYTMARNDENNAFAGLDGPISCTVQGYWHHWQLNVYGDAYGSQGYTGNGTGSDDWQTAPTGIYVWTITSTP
jgi:hypothetical protein